MFPFLPAPVLLESDQHLAIQLPNSNLDLRGTGLWHKWLGCMHFSLPDTTRSIYIQQLTEVILPPVLTFTTIRK
jgi:hypothetical protein